MTKRQSKDTHSLVAKSAASERSLPLNYEALVTTIAQAHEQAQQQAVQAVNLTLTLRNWLIGYYLVEYEQHGRDRAKYGTKLLETLAKDLRQRVGKGSPNVTSRCSAGSTFYTQLRKQCFRNST